MNTITTGKPSVLFGDRWIVPTSWKIDTSMGIDKLLWWEYDGVHYGPTDKWHWEMTMKDEE